MGIAGAAVGTAASIAGGIANARAMKKIEKNLKKQREENKEQRARWLVVDKCVLELVEPAHAFFNSLTYLLWFQIFVSHVTLVLIISYLCKAA